jgi:hypothetical protein
MSVLLCFYAFSFLTKALHSTVSSDANTPHTGMQKWRGGTEKLVYKTGV